MLGTCDIQAAAAASSKLTTTLLPACCSPQKSWLSSESSFTCTAPCSTR